MSIWEQIQKEAQANVWSRSNRYAQHVFVSFEDDDEWEGLVEDGDKEHNVYIGKSDDEWDCGCGSPVMPCVHICAVVIANKAQSVKKEEERETIALVGIRFVINSVESGLVLSMETDEENPIPIEGALAKYKNISVSNEDVLLLSKMSMFLGKPLQRNELELFLEHMIAQNQKIILNGNKIFPSVEQSGSLAIVEDIGDDFRVRIVRDPNVLAVYGNTGLLYKANKKRKELRLVGTNGLTQAQYSSFLRGVVYEVHDVHRLVSRIIPELKKRVPVDIRTERLPKDEVLEPYLLIDVQQKEESLLVHPKIVYGDPPIAEVFGEKITFLAKQVPIRDFKKENDIIERSLGILRIPIGMEKSFTAEDAVVHASFISKLVSENPTWKVQGQALSQFRVSDVLKPKITVSDSDMDIDFGGADPERVFEAWQANRSMVPLTGGGWAPLPEGWLNEYGHLVADLLSAKNASKGEIPKYALFDLARLCQKLDQNIPDLGGLRMLVSNFNGIKPAALPEDLNAELRSYQITGVNWLMFLKEMGIGGILADDMGLGKTLQTLCILESRSLVVVPTSVLSNWKNEANRFRPNLKVYIYHGNQRKFDKDADIILTSYAILRNDLETFQQEEWNIVVLDEAQAIKNPRSQTALAAFELKAKFRVALTGTPIENRLEELWSQMHFLCPGFLSGIKNFRKQYEVPIANGDAGVAQRLRDRIKPFVLRRLKKDVAKELPPRTNMTLFCSLSDEERALYDAVRAATYEEMVKALEEGKSYSVMSALEALLRMRQASCHSGLLPGQGAETSSKVELLIDRLMELTAAGHKALVFSQWTQFLDRIEPHLKKNDISYVRLDGSTKNRGEVVDRFQSEYGPSVFLASLKAGGTGLNLTAADHVFLMDPWWNPAVEEQAADRAHRIGQDNPVNVYRIVSEHTVEEKVLLLQERKRQIADAALNNAAQAAAITKEELMSLLE